MIAKVSPFNSDISVVAPPSKSYAHRLMIASALGSGKTVIKNVGTSDDVSATANCLSALGAKVEISSGNAEIVGIFGAEKTNSAVLNCGESGSTLRFLMPITSALGVKAEFTGKGKLLSRPNEILFDLLKRHGVTSDGYKLEGKLTSGVFEVDASVSSQYITGLLFALPLLDGDSEIILSGEVVSADYINITFEVLKLSGIKYNLDGRKITVYGNQKYTMPKEVVSEGDWSGASFLLSLGVISGKAEVKGLNINSAQGDKKILEIVKSAGGKVELGESVITYKSDLKGFKVNLENCPDLAPITCVLASYAKGISEISGLKRLKIKESDRLKAISDMLKEAKVKYTATDEKIIIYGTGEVFGGKFDGYKDHRIVMSATVLGSSAKGLSEVTDAESVAKSYPDFFEDINGGNNVVLER